MSRMKDVVRDLTPPIVVRAAKRALGGHAQQAASDPVMPSFASKAIGGFSQYGEDLVLDALMGCPQTGVYVDVGANDPVVFNNTKRFSLRGWRGIDVEPNPTLHAALAADRTEDICLNVGIGAEVAELDFYRLDPDTLSSFDEETAQRNTQEYPDSRIVDVLKIPVLTLSSLFESHLADRPIDFLSLDVEGGELSALGSNDWERWRPRFVLVEVNHSGPAIVEFMERSGYAYVWCNGTNGIFADSSA